MQPVQFHIRYQLQRTDQVTPLDHFIDAIRPDPPSQHELPVLVKQYLAKQGEAGEDLEVLFEQWISATPEAEQLIAGSPLLAEVQPRAQQMGELGTTGLQALDYIKKGKAAPADWVQSRMAMLDEAKKPAGLVRFTVLEPIQQLVEAAGGQK
jgi:hexosaminidase